MLKIRIIPVLLLKNGRCVKGKKFGSHKDTGDPVTAARVYDSQKADELIFLDIDAPGAAKEPLFDVITRVADQCFMPLCVGGRVRTLNDVKKLFTAGADKVAMSTVCYTDPDVVRKAATLYGSQSIVGVIDVRKVDGRQEVHIERGTKSIGVDAVTWAKNLESLGVGEVMITSIDHEGMMHGYDIELVKKVAQAVTIPVIAHGGAGNLIHIRDVINDANVSAIAAASIFHFTEQSTIKVRAYLHGERLPVRPVW